jgi:hypothetical protein
MDMHSVEARNNRVQVSVQPHRSSRVGYVLNHKAPNMRV